MAYSNIEFCTKDKTISYSQMSFIKVSLRKLGINPKNSGFDIFQKAIIYAYINDMIYINLEEIYIQLSKSCNLNYRMIKSNMRYAFDNINTKKLFTNYEDIFGFEFDNEYFSIKTLISDFIDLLDTHNYFSN